jgi:hypothetical protein
MLGTDEDSLTQENPNAIHNSAPGQADLFNTDLPPIPNAGQNNKDDSDDEEMNLPPIEARNYADS